MYKKYLLIAAVITCLFFNVLILSDDSAEEAESKENKTETRENILTDSSVIDLGNHIVAYRISSDMFDTDYDGEYIAIYDLTGNETLYLPDIYEEVYEMAIEENESIFICYKGMENDSIREIRIPVQFPSQMNMGYEVYKKEEKILIEAQKNIETDIAAFPKLIWKENAVWEGRTYEITFERTSPAYQSLILESGGLFADYCLIVKDEEDNIVSEQIIINYPIKYEEVYWFTDFSGDGFPDIAFCTDYQTPKNGYVHLEFMIWNAEEKTYEEKPLPVRSIDMPVWNETQSSVILFNNENEYITLGMYSFRDGDWELVGELVPSETDVDEYGLILTYGWKEIFYENGEAVEENSIIKEEKTYTPWFDEESVWSRYNKENSTLYPGHPAIGWEEIEVMIGENTIHKYVLRREDES